MRKVILIFITLFLITACNKYQDKPFITKENANTITVAEIKQILKDGTNIDVTRPTWPVTSLMLAVRYSKNMDIIRFLVKQGANLNKEDIYGKTSLLYALEYQPNNMELVQLLLEHGVDINNPDEKSNTPLMYAVKYKNNVDIIKLLIENNARVNPYTSDNSLAYAIKYNKSPEIVKLLISKGVKMSDSALFDALNSHQPLQTLKYLIAYGAEVGVKCNYAVTPLMYAVKNNYNSETINYLIKLGEKLNPNDCRDYETPLTFASRYNKHPAVFKALLKAGADVKFNFNRPLKNALRYKQSPSIVKILVKAGAKLNYPKGKLYSPLRYAILFYKNPEVLRTLIKLGAKVSKTDNTLLQDAIDTNQSVEFFKILVNAGANINLRVSYDNTTLLEDAITWPEIYNKSIDLKVIKFFLQAGADVNAESSKSLNALEYACMVKPKLNADVIALLLKTKPKKINQAFMLAIDHKPTKKILQLFIKAGVDVNKKSKDGDTLLLKAVKNGQDIHIIQALIDAGASVIVNNKDNTPFTYASKLKNKSEVMPMLIKALKSQTANSKALIYEYNIDDVTAETLKTALKGGADINAKNEYDQLPLILAIKHNKFDLVKVLLQAKPDLSLADKHGRTPLLSAIAYTKNKDMINLLLKAGSSTQDQDLKGKTSLMYAINHDQDVSVVNSLIKSGAKVNEEYVYKDPLSVATSHADNDNTFKIVKALIQAGANPKAHDGLSLVYAVDKQLVTKRYEKKAPVDIIRFLVQSGVKTGNITTYDDLNILASAIMCHMDLDVIQALIDGGGDVNDPLDSQPPLAYIFENYNTYNKHVRETPALTKMLIKAGVHVNTTDSDGKSPLISAIENYNLSDGATLKIVKMLIDAGAKVNLATKAKQTPLMYAAAMKYNVSHPQWSANSRRTYTAREFERLKSQLISVLLDHQANVNAKDIHGQTSLYFAKRFKSNPDIIQILVKAGAKE